MMPDEAHQCHVCVRSTSNGEPPLSSCICAEAFRGLDARGSHSFTNCAVDVTTVLHARNAIIIYSRFVDRATLAQRLCMCLCFVYLCMRNRGRGATGLLCARGRTSQDAGGDRQLLACGWSVYYSCLSKCRHSRSGRPSWGCRMLMPTTPSYLGVPLPPHYTTYST